MNQPIKIKSLLKISLLSALVAISSVSVAEDTKQQKASIDYRKSAYKMILWHFKPMAGMVKGKIDYDADAFAHNAKIFAQLSHLPIHGFELKSPSENSRAKASIWDNYSDFESKMDDFSEAADNLAKVAAKGDLGKAKPAFAAAAKTCKACHKEYRLDKK